MSDVELEPVTELNHSDSDMPNLEKKDISQSPREHCDSPTEPSDATCDEPEECGEISSPPPKEGKQFAVECELDFEDEAESVLDKTSLEKQTSETEVDGDAHILNAKDHEQSDEEDGQCTPEKRIPSKKNKNDESAEEGEDDGECTDGDDDLEEGELKEENGREENNATSASKPQARTVCRFYNRGQCFYGNVCRFLHLNFEKTGNYNMFAPSPRVGYADYEGVPLGNLGPTHGVINHRSAPLPRERGPDFMPVPPPLPPPPPTEPAALETAWERGLREAKELVKKANKRKVEEPDFEEKRLNLSLVVNEKNVPDFDKENDVCQSYKKKKRNETNPTQHTFKYDEGPDREVYDNDYEARTHWRQGRFENFEIRYTREGEQRERRDRDRGRGRGGVDHERDKIPKPPRSKERWRDDRLQQVQPARSRVEEYFDPWRRSKSPKGNRRTRSRSGSYSSVSSYSYSDKSSRSSCSYSRSSSPSSCRSSRSPHQKRKPSPPIAPAPASPKPGPNKFTPLKKKSGTRASSSRSRSMSRTPSISRSRSFSRSLSMDSVSSASSSISHSSSGSGSLGHRNSHASILRKQEENSVVEKNDPKVASTPAVAAAPVPLSSIYLEYPGISKSEKSKEIPNIGVNEDDRDPLEEKFQMPLEAPPFPSLQHLLPTSDKVKEPVKGLHKQQIKLTLLNKNPQSKVNSLPKKELDLNRKQTDEPSKAAGFYLGVKRPLSPPTPPVVAKPAPVLVPKKSASSRRDELLKQLKAVEDAIARKRAKFG